MALSVQLIAIKWHLGDFSVTQRIDLSWNPYKLREDNRFRDVDVTSHYLDSMAILSLDEVLEIERQMYIVDNDSAKAEECVNILREKLRDASFVIAQIYEWESGLPDG